MHLVGALLECGGGRRVCSGAQAPGTRGVQVCDHPDMPQVASDGGCRGRRGRARSGDGRRSGVRGSTASTPPDAVRGRVNAKLECIICPLQLAAHAGLSGGRWWDPAGWPWRGCPRPGSVPETLGGPAAGRDAV